MQAARAGSDLRQRHLVGTCRGVPATQRRDPAQGREHVGSEPRHQVRPIGTGKGERQEARVRHHLVTKTCPGWEHTRKARGSAKVSEGPQGDITQSRNGQSTQGEISSKKCKWNSTGMPVRGGRLVKWTAYHCRRPLGHGAALGGGGAECLGGQHGDAHADAYGPGAHTEGAWVMSQQHGAFCSRCEHRPPTSQRLRKSPPLKGQNRQAWHVLRVCGETVKKRKATVSKSWGSGCVCGEWRATGRASKLVASLWSELGHEHVDILVTVSFMGCNIHLFVCSPYVIQLMVFES